MLTSNEIRKSFLSFFENKGHKIVDSAPVVPYNDPTLLFTNAGMNQFKDVFLDTGTREYTRAADSQKCIRAGGKHNDLEEVGIDGYHHTFFEMLGNWSFGDYYKKEAIKWAWELLTIVWKLPKDKLWVTVYNTDDEALEIWKNETDINKNHILKFAEKDNFWEMGDTGPCGPCSEIHFDLTKNGCKPEDINAGLEDVIEIWNLVFIQYNRDKAGVLTPLPHKHIDTGMGFERIVRVLQNKKSNYETDVFTPLTENICKIVNKKYEGENISSINAIADHIRCLSFAIADGAIPSNEGRGYVLRRILRRAARLARKLGNNDLILCKLVNTVAETFSSIFPEVSEKKEYIKNIIKSEENSFNQTLDRGLELFNDVLSRIQNNTEKIFPGEDAFKLYDTFGFPIDLTQLIARENGFEVNMESFAAEMKKQKERARNARKDDSVIASSEKIDITKLKEKYSLIYNPYINKGEIVETKIVKVIDNNDKTLVILGNNPFYSESGGQISDTGELLFENGKSLKVVDSKDGYLISTEKTNFEFTAGDIVQSKVDFIRRYSIQKNHTATHLLHQTLYNVLGNHIKQMGSLVSDEYLRFDFPHFQKLSADDIKNIEDIVNEKIIDNLEIKTLENISMEQADKFPGIKKFFGEKYGDFVRVVRSDDNFSVELCGGIHVKNTKEIGFFKIIKEESISSGVRRIFAKTGNGVIELLSERENKINSMIDELSKIYRDIFTLEFNKMLSLKDIQKDNPLDIKTLFTKQDSYILKLKELKTAEEEENKKNEKAQLKKNLERIFSEMDDRLKTPEISSGFPLYLFEIRLSSTEEMKECSEWMRNKIRNGIGVIASVLNDKINLICSVSDNLIKENNLNAGKLVGAIAKRLGGGGGGKPQIATAGGKDINNLQKVLSEIPEIIKSLNN